MKTGGILFARMDSSRLPGKAMADVAGRPLVGHVLDAARRSRHVRDHIILATSDRAVDDPLADFAESENVLLFRGNIDDVTGRALSAAQAHGLDAFARILGDSPFWPADLVDQAFDLMTQTGAEFVTNLLPRSYPYGVAAEVMRTDLLARYYPLLENAEQKEHLTKWIYDNQDKVEHHSIVNREGDFSGIHLTVDTPEDLVRFMAQAGVSGVKGLDWRDYI